MAILYIKSKQLIQIKEEGMQNNRQNNKKLISFTKNDLPTIQEQINNGWAIVSLMAIKNEYIGIIEKLPNNEDKDFSNNF